jgi:hypothetical protein
MVLVHQSKVQFCWSGVTGMIAAFIGGMFMAAQMGGSGRECNRGRGERA